MVHPIALCVPNQHLPCPDPGFGVHHQSPSPHVVFLRPSGGLPSLLGQLLCYSSGVVGLEATAAPDVSYTHVIRLTSVLVHVPPCTDSGLQSYRKEIKLYCSFIISCTRTCTSFDNFQHLFSSPDAIDVI